jgi:hypothetical protein
MVKSQVKRNTKNFQIFFFFCIYENLYNFHVLLLTVCHQNEKNQSNPGKRYCTLHYRTEVGMGMGVSMYRENGRGGGHSQRMKGEYEDKQDKGGRGGAKEQGDQRSEG